MSYISKFTEILGEFGNITSRCFSKIPRRSFLFVPQRIYYSGNYHFYKYKVFPIWLKYYNWSYSQSNLRNFKTCNISPVYKKLLKVSIKNTRRPKYFSSNILLEKKVLQLFIDYYSAKIMSNCQWWTSAWVF